MGHRLALSVFQAALWGSSVKLILRGPIRTDSPGPVWCTTRRILQISFLNLSFSQWYKWRLLIATYS